MNLKVLWVCAYKLSNDLSNWFNELICLHSSFQVLDYIYTLKCLSVSYITLFAQSAVIPTQQQPGSRVQSSAWIVIEI